MSCIVLSLSRSDSLPLEARLGYLRRFAFRESYSRVLAAQWPMGGSGPNDRNYHHAKMMNEEGRTGSAGESRQCPSASFGILCRRHPRRPSPPASDASASSRQLSCDRSGTRRDLRCQLCGGAERPPLLPPPDPHRTKRGSLIHRLLVEEFFAQ
jgi:hypothetical protein